ncbi:flagellar hook-basal body complex protein FliE [Vulcanibacillus modesticaldus]|uniref:Flagellar hook-basal body complex protein FliE n=1 Tax=Vulcanibacillus modesticaldus TaxID=337097 RepID=A0A1D2YXJ9_9BACI|nr:flagellar hook-basal body complex protein FliE [Vulcanibacillus modesticaldus]OEG00398.1 flagellar hook-basal body complex protein FliE [Vulcanibacillus modesticaldus]
MDNSISSINLVKGQFITEKRQNKIDSSKQFSDVLKEALNGVTEDIKIAQELSDKIATGDVKDLHQVMIAMEKANLGLQLTVQVRNKVVEAYQEVMRMQV